MPLPLPNLDDRRWLDLVEEGLALIPRYARKWTDHNISDPGVTLIELFAWRTESSVYRINRTTDRQRMKFLSLIGFAPRPPLAARAMFRLRPAPAAAPFVLPAGVEFDARNPSGAVVPVRTLRAVTVADVRMAALQVDENRGRGLEDRTPEWKNGLPVRVFGLEPQPGAAFYFGFDVIPSSAAVTFAVRWDRPGADPVARALQSEDERARLIAERIARRRACGRPGPDIECPGTVPAPDEVPSTPPHHSARVIWEVYTGEWTPLAPAQSANPPNAGEMVDDTRSLTLDALVELNLPPSTTKKAIGGAGAALFYVRCRLLSGGYDAPPTLIDIVPNAVPAEQSVPLSQRFAIPAFVTPAGSAPTPGTTTRIRLHHDGSGVIQALTFDPTAAGLPDVVVLSYEKNPGAPGHLTLRMVFAGRGLGLPDQQLLLPARQIASDPHLRVYSHDGTSWREWESRPDFDPAARTSRHFVLNPARGTLTFGNGQRGLVTPRGDQVFITANATAGAGGTLHAGAPLQIRKSAVNELRLKGFLVPLNALADMTTLAWPASGGSDQETLAHASGRAAETLHAHDRVGDLARDTRTTTLDQISRERVRSLPAPSRAVSLLDLERIALDVPGTRVARARAWAGVLPGYPCLNATGAITLVVLPDLPVARPQPSAGLLRAVKRYLERRRMVATMLHVVGPTYRIVNVSARVRARRGAGVAALTTAIGAALKRFLDPLEGGPDGLGWPFGRSVYRAEILQLIDGVPGVDHVLDLSLSSPGGAPQCGNLTLCPTVLAAPGTADIRIE